MRIYSFKPLHAKTVKGNSPQKGFVTKGRYISKHFEVRITFWGYHIMMFILPGSFSMVCSISNKSFLLVPNNAKWQFSDFHFVKRKHQTQMRRTNILEIFVEVRKFWKTNYLTHSYWFRFVIVYWRIYVWYQKWSY